MFNFIFETDPKGLLPWSLNGCSGFNFGNRSGINLDNFFKFDNFFRFFKGQLISECLLGVIDFPKNQQEILQISVLESKKWSNHRMKHTIIHFKLKISHVIKYK